MAVYVLDKTKYIYFFLFQIVNPSVATGLIILLSRLNSVAAFKVAIHNLKVPKCEIFDRSDFHDFYTIKLIFFLIFRGSFWAAKFLTRMLSLILRSAVPSKHAEQ